MSSVIGILFPLLIAALVPIRMFASRYFDPTHVHALISEEAEGKPQGEKTHNLH